VVSPIGELSYRGAVHVVNDGRVGDLAARLYRELPAIQGGYKDDPWKWTVRVG